MSGQSILRVALATLLTCLAATSSARAQHVMELPDGRAEVIGLKRWTPSMLADSLGLHAPGVSLFQTEECTKALTSRLHFSSVYIEKRVIRGAQGDQVQSVVIRVVEPQDSAQIHWARIPRDSQPPRPEWADVRRVFYDARRQVFVEASDDLQLYGLYRKQGAAPAVARAAQIGFDTAHATALWRALERHVSDADRRLAIQTLRRDGSRQNRMMAAAILSNFEASDDAWHALAGALRDPYPGVNVAAMHSLTMLGNNFARTVNWTPATASLRAVLDGANLQAFMPLVRVLTQTHVAPSETRRLLKAGGELVVAHVEAADGRSRETAAAFLRQLAGTDRPTASWRAWVASL